MHVTIETTTEMENDKALILALYRDTSNIITHIMDNNLHTKPDMPDSLRDTINHTVLITSQTTLLMIRSQFLTKQQQDFLTHNLQTIKQAIQKH